MQYLSVGFFPITAPADITVAWNGRLRPDSWPEVAEKCRTRSLREVAKEYGVSHEAVRRMLTRSACLTKCP